MTEPIDEIRRRLAAFGIRYTDGRRRLIAALFDTAGPTGAAELHAELGGAIPVSTLYRSLAVLEETGVIDRHVGADGVARYELAEWLAGHHHHLVCTSCGAIEDVELDAEAERMLHAVAETAARRAGYRSSGHALEMQGECGRCR